MTLRPHESAELSHGIEVDPQSVNVDVSQEEIPKCIANSKVDSKLSRDIKPVNVVHTFSENSWFNLGRDSVYATF